MSLFNSRSSPETWQTHRFKKRIQSNPINKHAIGSNMGQRLCLIHTTPCISACAALIPIPSSSTVVLGAATMALGHFFTPPTRRLPLAKLFSIRWALYTAVRFPAPQPNGALLASDRLVSVRNRIVRQTPMIKREAETSDFILCGSESISSSAEEMQGRSLPPVRGQARSRSVRPGGHVRSRSDRLGRGG